MSFEVLETYACALIQCDCGDVLSLSGEGNGEPCAGCTRRYNLRVIVEEVNLTNEYTEGFLARQSGTAISSCGYEFGSQKRVDWCLGWAQENIALSVR